MEDHRLGYCRFQITIPGAGVRQCWSNNRTLLVWSLDQSQFHSLSALEPAGFELGFGALKTNYMAIVHLSHFSGDIPITCGAVPGDCSLRGLNLAMFSGSFLVASPVE